MGVGSRIFCYQDRKCGITGCCDVKRAAQYSDPRVISWTLYPQTCGISDKVTILYSAKVDPIMVDCCIKVDKWLGGIAHTSCIPLLSTAPFRSY